MPTGDVVEDLWRTYYASIFNPARLKIDAMLKEMPRKYWKNMPEAALIPELVAGAQAREAGMVEQGAMDHAERPVSLKAVGQTIHSCRLCSIGELDNHAVMGEGPQDALLMIVGENNPAIRRILLESPLLARQAGAIWRRRELTASKLTSPTR